MEVLIDLLIIFMTSLILKILWLPITHHIESKLLGLALL